MTTAIAERQGIREDIQNAIGQLSDAALEKLASYAAFLRYEERMEELEDEEDIAYLKTLTSKDYEDAIPFSEVVREFEAEHGPLYQN
jgi:hypothetical protein